MQHDDFTGETDTPAAYIGKGMSVRAMVFCSTGTTLLSVTTEKTISYDFKSTIIKYKIDGQYGEILGVSKGNRAFAPVLEGDLIINLMKAGHNMQIRIENGSRHDVTLKLRGFTRATRDVFATCKIQ